MPAMKLFSLQLPLQQMHWPKTFVLSLREATSTWLRCATINIVDYRSDNNNIVSAHHQAKRVDRTNNLHHSWEAPKHHKTNAWSVKE
jgi:hypothetical protein